MSDVEPWPAPPPADATDAEWWADHDRRAAIINRQVAAKFAAEWDATQPGLILFIRGVCLGAMFVGLWLIFRRVAG